MRVLIVKIKLQFLHIKRNVEATIHNIESCRRVLMTKGASRASNMYDSKWFANISSNFSLLQNERVCSIMTKCLKSDYVLVIFYQSVVTFSPLLVAVQATWGDVTDNENQH